VLASSVVDRGFLWCKGQRARLEGGRSWVSALASSVVDPPQKPTIYHTRSEHANLYTTETHDLNTLEASTLTHDLTHSRGAR
jgi:hypothetical protein